MFFGFDETWRWRFREDEVHFNQFWIQTIRYLAARPHQAARILRLDRQTPYRLGEPIKVTVRFPDDKPIARASGRARPGPKTEVKVIVEYRPNTQARRSGRAGSADDAAREARREPAQFEGTLTADARRQVSLPAHAPRTSATIQPDGEKPSAEAIVELPPGELDKICA